MIESTGQLDLDDRGYWNFHGASSGALFLRQMRKQLGGLLGEVQAPFLSRSPRHTCMITLLHSPEAGVVSPFETALSPTMDLPSRETARSLCSNSLDYAWALLRFVHHPTFYEMLEKIYDIPPECYGDDENRFLPLLYAVLALGCVFATSTSDPTEPEQLTYRATTDQG